MPKKIISIFGSGTIKEDSKAWRTAFQTGFELAKAGFVIANGGYEGSMLASAEGAKSAGGRTIGITTDAFRSKANPFIDQEIRFPTWQERLMHLIEKGNGFLILDGGTGTLTELMVVWEMLNKKFHSKPTVILGSTIKRDVRFLAKNPEIKPTPEFYFSKSPQESARYLKNKLS